jgi:hypothetical protein
MTKITWIKLITLLLIEAMIATKEISLWLSLGCLFIWIALVIPAQDRKP